MANIMWTADLIRNLKKYVDDHDFLVLYQNQKVCGITLPQSNYGLPVFYLQESSGITISNATPSDFKVFRLIEWDFQEYYKP